MGDIPVYVISLRDSEVRRRKMTEQLGALGIPFLFVDAIDGRSRRIPDLIDSARVARKGFYSESGLACAASHRLVHRIVAQGDSNLALVLEDDARIPEDLAEVLAGAAKFDFDVCKFEGVAHRRRAVIGRVGRYKVIVGTAASLGAGAYLIRRSAAVRLCGLPVIDQAMDIAFNDPRLSLRVFELEPHPVFQDGETPTLLRSQPYGSLEARDRRLSWFDRLAPYGSPQAIQHRLSWLERLAVSVRKRERLLRLYGLRVALAIELQKFRRMR